MAEHKSNVLIVEDDAGERQALLRLLRLEGFNVHAVRSVEEASELSDRPFDLVVSDLRLGARSGLELLEQWRRERRDTPFILVTAFGTVEVAVSAMKMGATDFVLKPVDPVPFLDLVHRLAVSPTRTPDEVDSVAQLNAGIGRELIVGHSRPLLAVCEQAMLAARSDSTVLVLGESGTGKELMAEALHCNSRRRERPFVVVNMAAIPDALVESELFGHVRGAFTTAVANRIGRFEEANGGTLFIDEIGDFPLALQAKLLRVLETLRITPVGGNQDIPVDVRIVAATSRPLPTLVREGSFRSDLFYRLNVISLTLPPLRERLADVPLLVRHFLVTFARKSNTPPREVDADLMQRLEALYWPGNIRQLRNAVERMCVLSRHDSLSLVDLPQELQESSSEAHEVPAAVTLDSIKRSAILQAIDRFQGNRTRAAAHLGISVRTLQRKLRDWGLAGPPPG